ncbi:MAG: murein biosynthesis integral membrane protein MurJ, partial [Chloroflexi bacterium]|nr:murein biosynthesis integral membrane protein MurJ [Chloroflexota bacterium]
AGIVMLAFLLSQVAGLVRQILATRAFGTGAAMDAFNTANIFPDLLFNLLAGGALASAFVPTFTAFLARNDHPSAWKLASSITNLAVLLLATISLVSSFLAPQIAHLLAPNYSPEKQALTAHLLRVLLITSTTFGLSGILSGIINSHQHFLLPALASAVYWTGIIIGLIFFVPSMGIFGLAWGAVLGSILHLCIQLPDLFRLPTRHYTPTLGLNNPSVREVVLLMGPRLISVAVLKLNMVVTGIIASGLPTGSLSAINYAFPIMTMPLVVIGSGIGFATLPTFSAQFARGEIDQMRSSLTAALRGVLFLSIPATIGLIVLRGPLIMFLFQRGNFSAESTQMVSWALFWYTVGLVAHCVLEILVRAFFALHDTKTPALISAGAMGLNILFSIAFPVWFQKMGWMPLGGLALAISLETAIETTVMFFLLRKRLQGIQVRDLAKGAGAALLATLFMGAVLVGWMQITQSHSAALTTVGGVAIGGAVYAVTVVVLRIPEVGSLVQMVKRRLSR